MTYATLPLMIRLTLITLLLLPFAVSAKAGDDDASFRSPSGNILCSAYIDYQNAPVVRCDMLKRDDPAPLMPMPADCDADWGNMFVVGKTGEASLECAGDLAADPSSPVLNYGSVIKKYGITCLSEKAGFTCINANGHGFSLSKAQQKLF